MARTKRKWDDAGDEDPAAGLLNLFDVWIAFAAALLLAMVSYFNMPEMLAKDSKMTMIKNPGTPEMEIVSKDGIKIEHYKASTQQLSGEGQRLGTAYRLKSGEVVYVPEG